MFPKILGLSSYQLINFISTLEVIIYISIFLKANPKKYAFYTSIICASLGLLGARLVMACYDIKNRFNFDYIFKLDYGGMDLGGAFLALPIAMLITHKLFKINYKELFEVIIEALILSSAIAKVACFYSGCCFGIKTDVPWAIETFRTNYLVHPVQLYETGIWIIVYIATMLTKNKMNNINRVCLITIGCIAMRMPVETLRYDAKMFIEGGYWIAYKILLVVCVITLIINNRKKIKGYLNKVVNNDKWIKGEENKRESRKQSKESANTK